MTRLTPIALGLVLLVLLAGCSGSDAGATPTPTENSTPTTTPLPTTTTPGDDRLAPGVTNAGLVDADALLSAHRETLLADGAAIRLEVTVAGGNGTVTQRTSQTAEIGSNGFPVATNGSGTVPDGDQQVDAWLNETTSLFRFRAGGETTYRALDQPAGGTAELVFAGNVHLYVRAAADAFAVRNVETRDDRRLVTLAAEADLVNGSAGVDTEITMVVDDRGVIRSFDLEQRQAEGERYRVDFALERLGVSPTRPDWVDSIPPGVFLETDLNVEVLDGRTIQLTNAGPDAVPAGATVTVVAGGATYDVTLGDPLGPGGERWLWVDADTGALTVGSDRPGADAARSLGTRATIVVRTQDGVTLVTADLAWRDRSDD